MGAPEYPNCNWNCSAKDVTVVEAFVNAPDTCTPGQPLSAVIYAEFDNGTNSNRYAVRVIGDLYVNGRFKTSINVCVGDTLPPGTSTLPLTSVSWECGETVEIRIATVSWTSSPETCTDTPKCASRATKCWFTPRTVIGGLPLSVDFTSSSPECDGSPVSFVSETSGGAAPYTYRWSFGDGGTSNSANPSHLYASPGSYSVTLTVTDDDGVTGSASYTVAVSPNPVAAASNGGPYCPGATIELFASGGTSYNWIGPNGFTSTDQNPTIASATGSAAGVYTVTVANTSGCTDEGSTLVEIDLTAPALTVPPAVTTECGTLTDPVQTGQATATDDIDRNPDVTYSDIEDLSECGNTGTITRTWTATDACVNTSSGVQTITIVDTTPPTLTISSAQFECDGAGNANDIAAWLASAAGTDACGGVTVTNDYAGLTGDCPGIGSVNVTFTATDACSNSTQRTATLTLVDTVPPIAISDADTTDEGAAVLIDAVANDSDACDPSPMLLSVATPSAGTAEIAGGQIRYIPPAGYSGAAAFSYTIADCSGNLASTLVEVTVIPANDSPLASNQSTTIQEDTPAPITLTATDPDGDPLTYVIVAGPAHGTILGFDPATGTLTYAPVNDYNGPDAFTFEACDPEGLCDTGIVTITVEPVDDPPLADPQNLTTPEDTPLAITVTGSDKDADPLAYAIISGPSDGTILGFDPVTGDLLYTPDTNFTGTDSLVFEVCDPDVGHGCAQATVTIVVAPVNDPPVANDQGRATPEDTPTGFFALSVLDPDHTLAELSCDCLTPPAHGTVARGPDHTVNYTPDPNFAGTDAFTYEVCDPEGLCDTATVTVTVSATNDNPVISASNQTTPEDTPIAFPVAHSDPDGDPLTCTAGDPAHGSVAPSSGTVSPPYPAMGILTYTPDPGFSGIDQIVITCDDNLGGTDSVTVEITVTPVNDPPVANDQRVTAQEDTPQSITVTGSDPDGDPLTYSILTGTSNGTILGFDPETGTLLYTPNAHYYGPDSFVFVVCDPSGACDAATVTIVVEPVDDLPVALPQALTTPEDTPQTIGLIGIDADDDALTYGIVSGPANGTLSKFDPATGALIYTPDANFTGTDALVFEVCDPHPDHGCAQATVTITVTPVNDPPVAQDQFRSTSEDSETGFFSLLVSDPDNTLAEIVCDCQVPPSHGTVVRGPDHTVNYIPDPDFSGTDSFTYEVCDPSGLCDTATVTVNVTAADDPPVAADDAVEVAEDGRVDIDVPANDSDPDGNLDRTSVAVLTQPAHGDVTVNPVTGVVTYEPDADFTGTDAFAYEICDNQGLCDVATVRVEVNPVDDPPVATDDTARVAEDGSVAIDVPANDSDPDGDLDITSVTIISTPSNGTVSIAPATGRITYEPDDDFNGIDTFTYQICDRLNVCDTATVEVSVVPVNDPPLAKNDSTSTPEDVAVTIDVPANDYDVDGNLDRTTLAITAQPSNGALKVDGTTGEVTYAPAPDFHGTDSFGYRICDTGGLCDAASVTVIVGPEDDPPVARDDSATVLEDGVTTIAVADNDSDPDGNLDPTSVVVTAPPAHGDVTVDPATGEIDYAPDPNYHGPDRFGYEICDTDGECNVATVTIDVVPVDDPPVANDDGASVAEDGSVLIDVPDNDSDPDGDLDPTTVMVLTLPSNGTARVDSATGEITYEPNPNFNGTDAFSYRICDLLGACDTAQVSVTIAPVDDLPVAVPQDLTTPEDTPLSIGLIGSDADNDPLTYNILDGPSNGTISGFDSTTGGLVYTPNGNYHGPDRFTFAVCDPHPNECGIAPVTITVTPVDDPPFAMSDSAVVAEDGSIIIDVPNNDTDPDGDLEIRSVYLASSPSNGNAAVDPVTGEITYTPDPDFAGIDVFTYRICDRLGACDTAPVSVLVIPLNDPPVANDDAALTQEDTPVRIPVTLNDNDPDGEIDPATLVLVSAPSHGNATIDPETGDITYTPAPNYSGPDSLAYRVCNTESACDVAVVEIEITPENDPPVAACLETVAVDANAVRIELQASDPDGDEVTYRILEGPEHGAILDFDEQEGSFTYVPSGFLGPDVIAYEAVDPSGASDRCIVQLFVVSAGSGGDTCEQRVIISEVAWSGTKANPDHEWIELRNLTDEPINLEGWTLRWRRKNPETADDGLWTAIPLSGRIDSTQADAGLTFRPHELQPGAWWVFWEADWRDDFFLLERETDEPVLHIEADLIYPDELPLGRIAYLDDRGDVLELVMPSGCIADTANAADSGRSEWAAGHLEPTATMERTNPLERDLADNWHTNLGLIRAEMDAWANLIHGTPKHENSPILSEAVAAQGIEPTRHPMSEPILLRFDALPEWPAARGLWYVVVTHPTSDTVLKPTWTIRTEESGGLAIEVAANALPINEEIHVWVRTPSGDLLCAPVLLYPY